MKIVALAEVKARLSAYLDEASDHGPVVITRNGKAAAVLIAPVDDEDLERLLLSRSPQFSGLLERSRRSAENGKPLSREEFWHALEQGEPYRQKLQPAARAVREKQASYRKTKPKKE